MPADSARLTDGSPVSPRLQNVNKENIAKSTGAIAGCTAPAAAADLAAVARGIGLKVGKNNNIPTTRQSHRRSIEVSMAFLSNPRHPLFDRKRRAATRCKRRATRPKRRATRHKRRAAA
jgi:hypothetical protein